jgi:uncharacterized protein YndB with AHSA1/START domain
MRYDAPPADVYKMLADPEFREKVCVAAGAVRQQVSVTPAGNGMIVQIDQTQPAHGIPSFATKFVGDEIQIVQQERWSGDAAADFTLEIPGKPGRCTGTVTLADDGNGGTLETVSGDLKVNIPLVGGKLEALISDMVKAAMRKEEQVGRSWLAG